MADITLDETLGDDMRTKAMEEMNRFIEADPTSFIRIVAKGLAEEPGVSLYMETSEWNWHLGEDRRLSDIILACDGDNDAEIIMAIHGLEQAARRLASHLCAKGGYEHHPTLGAVPAGTAGGVRDDDLHPDWNVERGVGSRFADWRTYVGPHLRRIWHTLPLETRTAIRLDADEYARDVYWAAAMNAKKDDEAEEAASGTSV